MRRSVLFTVPLSIAEDYHQAVSAALSDTLVRGQTLVIYDTSDERCYEIQYASWFPGQFAEMTQAQFDADTLQVTGRCCPTLAAAIRKRWASLHSVCRKPWHASLETDPAGRHYRATLR